jgi:NAD(P)-dependent dehydrogenase (short-subunit alcohol dehydrogenase family)/CMP-N-acetylneuraminic acid synthetase
MICEDIKVVAIIPIKHHSSRVPQKNYRMLGEKPLYHHILDTLISSKLFSQIIVDTNSPIIKEGCKKNYPEVYILDRPDELCGDDISTNRLIQNILDNIKYDETRTLFFQTHATNPFLTTDTIKKAIGIIMDNRVQTTNQLEFNINDKIYDSLFSANKHQIRLYTKDCMPLNHSISELIPTQNLDPLYEENSCIYLFTANSFKKKQHRIGDKPYMFNIESRIESLDIDWEDDFIIAEAICNYGYSNNPSKYVVVTGALGGIGYECAKYFRSHGWSVIGLDIVELDNCNNNIFKLFIRCDITAPNISDYLKSEFEKHNIDRIDSWINVSAIQQCVEIIETTNDDWDKIMNCNLKAIFVLSKFAVPYLQKTNGSIVNIASVHSIASSANIATYATSKAALVGLTRNMAIEFAKYGIRVNGISPGAVNTQMLRNGLIRDIESPTQEMLDTALYNLGRKHICNRVGEPIDIAKAIYFLADNNSSSFIYGVNLVVDGGATIKLSTE